MNQAMQLNADGLDPDIRRFVTEIQRAYGRFPNFDALSLDERRRVAEQVRAPWRGGGPAMQRTSDLSIAGCRARLYVPAGTTLETPSGTLPGTSPATSRAAPPATQTPSGNSSGAMLYLHGGGWMLFSIDTHDRLMREYAARAGVMVLGLDYRLSPESKFPAALEDAGAALDWMQREGPAHGIDPARLAVGGDSAGANLAVATALKLRELGRPALRALLLNYGAFGPEPSASFDRYGGPSYMLTAPEMRMFWDNYTRCPKDLRDPLVAPLLADLRGLPPALFTIAACDILADGNRAMAARFAAAGVPAEVQIYEGATHSFLEAVSISTLADRALGHAALWLRRQLAG